jgi:O-antigen/teichoic acid export membrane protein
VVGLSFLADGVLLLMYGRDDFLLASRALRILVWSLIPIGLDHVLGMVLMASLRERLTLRIVAIDVVVGLVLGLVLVSRFGLIGAAIAALITRIVDLIQHYVPVSRLLPRMSVTLRRAAWKPVVATIFMALCLAVVRGRGLVLAVASGCAAYAAILLALTVWSEGGISRFKARYLRVWDRGPRSVSGEEAR